MVYSSLNFRAIYHSLLFITINWLVIAFMIRRTTVSVPLFACILHEEDIICAQTLCLLPFGTHENIIFSENMKYVHKHLKHIFSSTASIFAETALSCALYMLLHIKYCYGYVYRGKLTTQKLFNEIWILRCKITSCIIPRSDWIHE